MADIYDPGGLTDFSSDPMAGFDWGSLFSGSDPFSDINDLLLGTPGLSGEQWFIDTVTGGLVTLAQAQAIDPTFNPEGAMSQTPTGMYSGGGSGGIGAPPGTQTPPPGSPPRPTDWARLLPALLAGGMGVGSLGAAVAGMFGAGNQPGTATQTSTTTPNALSNPQVQQLLGSAGTQGAAYTGGSSDFDEATGLYRSTGTANPPTGTAYTGGTGLQGAAGQAAANMQGPQGLLQRQIGAIPQLNPALQAAIGQNALGFSQGNVPTLNNPQAQSYFQNMLSGQNASVDYQSGNALTDAMQQLRNRGFAGGAEIFREGAPAAAMGPILAQANAQKAMNLGNINAQQLAYATQLPKLGADLGTAGLNQQAIPFNAYTQALGSQSQIPQALLQALMGQGGSNTTQTSTGAAPNFMQSLGQVAPLIGAAGGFLSSPAVSGTQPGSLYGGTTGTPSLWSQLGGLFG